MTRPNGAHGRLLELRRGVAVRLRDAGRVLRQVVGAPDYERYLAHMRRHHPGAQALSPAEFACQRLEAKYSRPGAKCC